MWTTTAVYWKKKEKVFANAKSRYSNIFVGVSNSFIGKIIYDDSLS